MSCRSCALAGWLVGLWTVPAAWALGGWLVSAPSQLAQVLVALATAIALARLCWRAATRRPEAATAHAYRCAACGGTFDSLRSQEDAEAEAQRDWGVAGASRRDDMSEVCHDCYTAFMVWHGPAPGQQALEGGQRWQAQTRGASSGTRPPRTSRRRARWSTPATSTGRPGR